MTDYEEKREDRDEDEEDVLLEEQEQKGYGADEGEREEALDETAPSEDS